MCWVLGCRRCVLCCSQIIAPAGAREFEILALFKKKTRPKRSREKLVRGLHEDSPDADKDGDHPSAPTTHQRRWRGFISESLPRTCPNSEGTQLKESTRDDGTVVLPSREELELMNDDVAFAA